MADKKRVAEMTVQEIKDLILAPRFEDVIDAGYIWDNGLVPGVKALNMFDIPDKQGRNATQISYVYSVHLNAFFDGCEVINGVPKMTYRRLDWNPIFPMHVELVNDYAWINGKPKRIYYGIIFFRFHGEIH
jgi:hypothetical protein